MTPSPSTLTTVAGVLSLAFAALLIHGTRSAIRKPPLPSVSLAPESLRLFSLASTFVPFLFGMLSLAFDEAMVTTPLGLALCAGMGIFFALRGWAYVRSREMYAARPYIGTYVAFAAAGCYVVAAIAGSVS